MARRTEHSREELMALALDAAERLAAEAGGDGVTARAVAKAIGYAPGTLYNLFANRDELILRLNARTLARLRARLAMAGGEVPALVDAYVDFARTEPGPWRMIFDHRLPEGQVIPDWYAAEIAATLGVVEAALGGDERATSMARTLWGGIHGLLDLADSGKLAVVSDDDVAAMARDLAESYLKGKGRVGS